MRVEPVDISLRNNRKKTAVAFGSGAVDVVISPELYFGESLLENIEKSDPDKVVVSAVRVKRFIPFRRICEISSGSKDPYINNFRVHTFLPQAVHKNINKFFDKKYKGQRRTIWLPDSYVLEQTGQVFERVEREYSPSKSLPLDVASNTVEHNFVQSIKERIARTKESDFIIAIGSTEDDLKYLNPFSYFGLEPSYENFYAIKDMPLHSAFIVDSNTPKDLLNKVEKMEKFCNADGNIRFIKLKKGAFKEQSAVVQAILLLQKEYAKRFESFRSSISEKLKTLLENIDLSYTVSHDSSSHVDYSPAPFWADLESKIKLPFYKKVLNYVKNNKLACSIVAASVGIPVYFKLNYGSKDNAKTG